MAWRKGFYRKCIGDKLGHLWSLVVPYSVYYRMSKYEALSYCSIVNSLQQEFIVEEKQGGWDKVNYC